MATKDIFCSKEQIVTAHNGEVDTNGEFLFTCTTVDCGRFVKFPADTDLDTFNKLVPAHAEANKGQVSLEGQEEKLQEFLGLASAEPAPEVPDQPTE